MPPGPESRRLVFPRWANLLLPALGVTLVAAPIYVVAVVGYAASPRTTNVGYAPVQPLPYSHAMHVGQLRMDCRYCHTTVETTSFAAVPPTQVCLNCHNPQTQVRWTGEKLAPLRESAETGEPIAWTKVNDLPDYVYFDHASHVQKGVGCVECHGRVDRMERVHQVSPFVMGACLDCHNNPGPRIRPRGRITDMKWSPDRATPAERQEMERLRAGLRDARQMTDCSTCHR